MAIKRFFATMDNTVTNAMRSALSDSSRATGSNMGAADVLETFSIYGQASSSSGLSQELSRILIQFPVTTISSSRDAGTIPQRGSASFYLRMFNARHTYTLPRRFTLNVVPVSQSWEEGVGLDMTEYVDKTYDNSGSNWINRGKQSQWAQVGASYVTSSAFSSVNYTQFFDVGYEDLELDITDLVEKWITGSTATTAGGSPVGDGLDNYGLGVHFTSSQEAYYSSSLGVGVNDGSIIDNRDGSTESYYTKKFFSRSSEFFFKKPCVEVRWDSSLKDNRGSFYFSSSLAPASDNLNTLYLYNYVRGQLVNIPGIGTTGSILLSVYSGSSSPTGSKLLLPAGGGVASNLDVNVTGGWVSTGIYSASFAATGSLDKIFDVWHSSSIQYFTSSFAPSPLAAYSGAPTFDYVTNVTNLKPKYSRSETARMRLFVRSKNWDPNIYTVATAVIPNETILSASYKIIRTTDNLEVVSYGTGSDRSTYLSYDVSGNYFDIDIGMLEADYSYGIKFVYYNNSINTWVEQPYMFRFRVEEDT